MTQATISKNEQGIEMITITVPVVRAISKSEKSILIASVSEKVNLMYEGKQVKVSLNAYVAK